MQTDRRTDGRTRRSQQSLFAILRTVPKYSIFCLHSTYVLCTDLRKKNAYFYILHELIGFLTEKVYCAERTEHLNIMYHILILVFKGLL
jgi:hypothetical protein